MRKEKFKESVKIMNLDLKKGLKQDLITRWNSTYHMLESALCYDAFDHLSLCDSNY